MGATRRLQTTVDGNCVAVNAEEAAKKRRRRRRNRKQKRQHKMTVEVGLSSAYGTCSIVASNVVVVAVVVAVVRMPSPSLHFAAERIHYSKCYLCKHLTIRNAQAIV